ncbi:large ribosomal subunit protein eL30 isoform X1 [Sagmatias obliquidens]|uniref:large ribosomal subunit protein eL30 isoform X1 n=1 Tax=Sagmatias obliquidens TaxID=3371155 RepID=UPI000F44404F|nr:60S ribosomal protein L30 isoform X1 [Lagenorhynchus obliquidens]
MHSAALRPRSSRRRRRRLFSPPLPPHSQSVSPTRVRFYVPQASAMSSGTTQTARFTARSRQVNSTSQLPNQFQSPRDTHISPSLLAPPLPLVICFSFRSRGLSPEVKSVALWDFLPFSLSGHLGGCSGLGASRA